MTTFKEFNEYLKTILEANSSLRDENPSAFWLMIFNEHLDSLSGGIGDYIEKFALPATKQAIKRQEQSPRPLPVHLCFDPQEYFFKTPRNYVPDFFPYLYTQVHMVAHNKKELTTPMCRPIALLRLQEGIYMLMVTSDEKGTMLEVFPPHFWNRYLNRVKRNSLGSGDLPDAQLFDNDKVVPTFEQTIKAVGHFIGRNWFFTTTKEPALFSKKKQKNMQEKDMATVFIDGYSWDDVFERSQGSHHLTIIIHKSYISWSQLQDDQKDYILPYKAKHLSLLLQDYPECTLDILTWMEETDLLNALLNKIGWTKTQQ